MDSTEYSEQKASEDAAATRAAIVLRESLHELFGQSEGWKTERLLMGQTDDYRPAQGIIVRVEDLVKVYQAALAYDETLAVMGIRLPSLP